MGTIAAIFPVVMAGAALATAACSGARGAPSTPGGGEAQGPAVAVAASPSTPPGAGSAPPADATATAAPAEKGGNDTGAKAAPEPVVRPIPAGTAVLHVGDSFAVAGFAQALRPRMQALGVRYEVRAETSSFTTSWSHKMEKVVADTQPDLVIINLGANEVSNTDPATHAPHVRRIVKAIGGRPCVWVSPPLWRKDTGITEVIRENSAPCRFFDSDLLVKQPIPRQSDHIHPNAEGGAIWAEAFWAWLGAERAPTEDSKASPWLLKPAPPGEHEAAAAVR